MVKVELVGIHTDWFQSRPSEATLGRYQPWLRPDAALKERCPGSAEFYLELFGRGRVVRQLDPKVENRPGPTATVVALR